eukprot:886889-Rhodomonas_salina.2
MEMHTHDVHADTRTRTETRGHGDTHAHACTRMHTPQQPRHRSGHGALRRAGRECRVVCWGRLWSVCVEWRAESGASRVCGLGSRVCGLWSGV